MQQQKITLYIDMTGIIGSRINTGIQRVLKEFVQRTLGAPELIDYCYLNYKQSEKTFHVVASDQVSLFLNDIKNYEFSHEEKIDLFKPQHGSSSVFFDMDSVWNINPKRLHLYPELKKHNYLILNYLYDLSPVVLPQFSHENTCRNFISFLSAVYAYSDMVYFDSASAERDFFTVKKTLDVTREIPTHVTGLGSDYTQNNKKTLSASPYAQQLNTKYLLFVGTLEPRKSQELVLDSFEVLAKKYPDLNLILIGKQGWKVERFIERINTHPLYGKQFYYLNDIDDDTLSLFYQNAWMVVYLSKHEGYGLPIAEALHYGNITLASKNSSMYEVGRNFADYAVYNSQQEIIDAVSLYYDQPDLYQAKKQAIKEGFKPVSWDSVSASIIQTFKQLPMALELQHELLSLSSNSATELQFIIISIDIDKLQQSIKALDQHIHFIKEYIVITHASKLAQASALSTTNKLLVVDENDILGEFSAGFEMRDHQQKNWLLRASVVNLPELDDNFVMLDDDSRPLKTIEIDYFISRDGRYNAYYFYDLLNWHSHTSDYDKGQHNTQRVLSEHNYELLSYSSHAPQIINKRIFSKMLGQFFRNGLDSSIDEWSIYFNYAVSNYPYAFNKQVFQALNWPALPTDWKYQYTPESYAFENYYPEVYALDDEPLSELRYFRETDTAEKKIAIKASKYQAHGLTYQIFDQYQVFLAKNNLIYGCLAFETKDLSCYLFSVPKQLITLSGAQFRLTMNCKVLNKTDRQQQLEVCYLYKGKVMHSVNLNMPSGQYGETIVELPISTYGMKRQTYKIKLDVRVNGQGVYGKKSPYNISIKNHQYAAQVKLPKTINRLVVNDALFKGHRYNFKHFVKQLPYVGVISTKIYRWMYRKG